MQRIIVRVLLAVFVFSLVLSLFQQQPVQAELDSSGGHLLLGNPTNAVTDPAFPANYLIERPQYALSYARDAGIPNWVAWHLEAGDIGSTGRVGNFAPDPLLPDGWHRVGSGDYGGSGYDRGHMVPSGDRTLTVDDNQSTFYMTNMIPQHPDNNQGPWVGLETYSRSLAQLGNELYIISGGYGSLGTISSGRINIPARTWKVVVVLPNGNNDVQRVNTSTRIIAIDMPNIAGIRSDSWQNYRVSTDSIEAATGYDFLSNVPVNIQAVIEAHIDGQATATPTVTPTGPTATPSSTPTASATAIPTWTATAPPVASATITPTATLGATASATTISTTEPTPTSTIDISATPSVIDPWSQFLPIVRKPEPFVPTPTPTATATATNTATATATDQPTATATATATATQQPTFTPTITTTPVPVTCNQTVSTTAPNNPIAIINVDKQAETVTLQNVSAQPVDLTDWWICSDRGDQLHAVLSGTLPAGQQILIPSQAGGPIWSNSDPDAAALYNSQGIQIGYRNQ